MAELELKNVSVEIPILHMPHRSLKKTLVATATRGVIMHESGAVPIVRALSNITCHFTAGDRVGLIGPNGSGKTTLLRTMAGIYEPSQGWVGAKGRITTLIELGLGFNGDMTGRENISLRAMYMGVRPKDSQRLIPEIEAFADLGDYMDMPFRTYSSGMQLRLTFAIATSIRPDILLMDEWMVAGDAAFLAKAQARMEQFVSSSSILFLASHSDAIIRQWCNKAMYLSGGELKSFGDVNTVLAAYTKSQGAAE